LFYQIKTSEYLNFFILKKKFHEEPNITPLKPLGQFEASFGRMVLGWSPFRIVSDNPLCQPRWLPLLKIENSAKNHLKIFLSVMADILAGSRVVGQNSEMGSPKDHSTIVWAQLVQQFQRR
jgi:hypothetical protein